MDKDGSEGSRRQSSMNEVEEDAGDDGNRLSDYDDNKASTISSRSSSQFSEEETDDTFVISPIFYYLVAFLAIATVLQVNSTSKNRTGPFDYTAEVLVPNFHSLGLSAGPISDDEIGMDGRLCPPDKWIDDSFEIMSTKTVPTSFNQYSSENDPRDKISRPSLFPHCALTRWVQMGKEHDCPAGTEYVTIILPPKISKQSEEGKIPKIVHLLSPTNCLPSSVVGTLTALTSQHISQAFTIYVHSHRTVDSFLFQREWNVFPQVKEGILCGMGKLKVATQAAMQELKFGNTTEVRQPTVDRIAYGVTRDIWRHLVLWEYGGVTLDMDTLHAILTDEGGIPTPTTANTTSSTTSHHKGVNTLRKMMQQWSAEKSDAIMYFFNNVNKQRLPYKERIPLTEIMVMAPHHPVNYYSAKVLMKKAVWDDEIPITAIGRTTKVPSLRDGMQYVSSAWRQVQTGDVWRIAPNEGNFTVHFLDADDILPPSLTSPSTTPWKTILDAFKYSNLENKPTDDSVNNMMRSFAAQQQYIPGVGFSCMGFTLDLYTGKTSQKLIVNK